MVDAFSVDVPMAYYPLYTIIVYIYMVYHILVFITNFTSFPESLFIKWEKTKKD